MSVNEPTTLLPLATQKITIAIAKSNTEFTSAAATNATSKFTFAGGNPVTEGLKVGDFIQFTNLSESANNSTSFKITSFADASNRTVNVTPAPTDMSADTSFNVAVVSAVNPTAFDSQTRIVRLFMTGATATAFYNVTNGIEATNGDVPITNNIIEYISMDSGVDIAVNGTDGTFHITETTK